MEIVRTDVAVTSQSCENMMDALAKKYPFIRLELILPCKDQTKKWCERDRTIYEYIASEADDIKYVTDTYTQTCMHERNRRLVEGSDYCVTYLSDGYGGTAYTVDYAKKHGVDVINLYDKLEYPEN